jgi:4-amino-4-deoxy-L-arabinose transferase-like glycosyltransferase
MDRTAIFQKQSLPIWTAEALALLGLAIYFIQSMAFAYNTVSNLDEGAYLLKGYLFATDQYDPFDPGVATTKPPLAFQIPGYAQLLFGPGLRTGRYLAAFFGALAVIGTYAAARRIGGRWLAAAAVWVLAASPMVIKFYSGSTQSTVACLLAWSLALALGEQRSFWQLTLAGLFAGIMMLVRPNLMPVLPLLIVYSFWQHGWKAWGLMSAGVFVVALTFYVYWPDFLQLWYWVPFIRIPDGIQYAGGGIHTTYTPDIPFKSRVLAAVQGIRYHFIPLIGSLISLLFLPKLKNWKSRADLGVALFLFLLFAGLLYMHFMAAVALDYCTFCFSPYIAFFNIVGVLLVVALVKVWEEEQPRVFSRIMLILIFLAASAAVGLSAFEQIGAALLDLPAPRIRDLRILPGSVTWEQLLSNKFHLDYNDAMRYASAAFGLIVGVLIVLIGYIIWRRARRYASSFGVFLAGMILILGIVLSPVVHGRVNDCNSDVIAANELNGEYLRSVIPPGSVVYWDGGLSVAPLLYLPGIKIFPAQINAGYNFLSGADTAQTIKFGYWNEELMEEWKAAAGFFIIEDQYYMPWKEFFNSQSFVELKRSPVGTSCLPGSRLRIFRRK